MLVAPVLDPGGVRTAHFAADQIPVFVRRGAIVPEQPADLAWSDAKPLDRVFLDVYGDGAGRFTLNEDHGLSPERHAT